MNCIATLSQLFAAFESPRKPLTGLFLVDSGYNAERVAAHTYPQLADFGGMGMPIVSHEARSKKMNRGPKTSVTLPSR